MIPNPETTTEQLPSYITKRLNIADELIRFSNGLKKLDAGDFYLGAEECCIASQQIIYALDEIKWKAGEGDPIYLENLSKSVELIRTIETRKGEIPPDYADQVDVINLFFTNIMTRLDVLEERLKG